MITIIHSDLVRVPTLLVIYEMVHSPQHMCTCTDRKQERWPHPLIPRFKVTHYDHLCETGARGYYECLVSD